MSAPKNRRNDWSVRFRNEEEEKRILKRCQREISERTFVTAAAIEDKYMNEKYGEQQNRRCYNSYLFNVERLEASVNTCVASAIATNIIITLYDVEKEILQLEDFKKAKITNFSDAMLGRLVNHKTVQRHFKVAAEVQETPAIETHKLLMFISKRLLKEGNRTREEDKEAFLKSLTEKIYSILDEYAKKKLSANATHKNLCIFVKDSALAFWNFTVSRFGFVNRKTGRKLLEEYEEESKSYFIEEHRKSVNKRLARGNAFVSALHNLLSGRVGDDTTKVLLVPGLIKRFFPTIKEKETNEFLSIILVILAKNFHPESLVAREVSLFNERFVRTMSKKITELEFNGDLLALLCKLEKIYAKTSQAPDGEHFVGCFNYLNSFGELRDAFQFKTKGITIGSGKHHSGVSKTDLIQQTKGFMQDKQDNLLQSLVSVEAKLLEFYRVSSFEELGHGSFVKFCSENSLELSISTDSDSRESSYSTASHRSVINFVKGMRRTNNVTRDQILTSLARQFDSLRLQSIVPQLDQLINADIDEDQHIPCLEWFLFDSNVTFEPQNEAKALAIISNAPLLTDLYQWSNWNSIFAPELGDIRTFLAKQIASGNFTGIIELHENCFVRYTASPSLDVKIVSHGEITLSGREVAGWFVGHLVKSRNFKSCSIEAIREIIAKELQQIPNIELRLSWILEVLEALPPTVVDLAGFDVFIQPIYSWDFLTPEEAFSTMIELCQTEGQRAALHRVGLRNSLQCWVDDFTASRRKRVSLENVAKNIEESSVSVPTPSSIPVPPIIVEQQKELQPLILGVHSIFNRIANKFGCSLDEHLTEEQQEQLQSLRALVKRSITRLSGELYAEDVHFLLELIQNADDNTYIHEVIPELRIIIAHQCLELQNNEIGFDSSNVEALCSIGESTKHNKKGYIGRKGIGFKSVFKVTDTPIVHSNEFHFGFDRNREDGLGFVIPIPQTIPSDWQDQNNVTRIILPISETSSISFANIKKCISDVTPSLLLFLHKLRRIVVIDENNSIREMERIDDLTRNIIILKDTCKGKTVAEKWLVVRKSLEFESADGTSQKTEIALGFPLNFLKTYQLDPIPQQQVFAYLPLRSYGFRFVIQADWATTSSRESIDGAQAGNQRLREYIAGVFCEASFEFVERANKARTREVKIKTKTNVIEEEDAVDFDDLVSEIREEVSFVFNEKSVNWINFFLRFIPLPGQISGEFFHSVAYGIWLLLQTTCFIPTIDNRWEIPPNAIDFPSAPDHIITRLKNELDKCSLSLVSPYLDMPQPLKKEIHLGKLDGRTIIRLLRNPKTKKFKSEVDCEWVVWLLDQLYNDSQFSQHIPELKSIPFIPLSDSKFSSVSEGAIYLLEAKAKNFCPIDRLLHPNISLFLEKYPKANNALRRIDVTPLNDHTYVEQFLLKKLRTTSPAPTSVEAVECLRYAFFHASGHCETCSKEKGLKWLINKLENGSWWVVTSEKQVVSSEGNNLHVEDCPSDYTITTWTTVSKDYFEKERASNFYPVFRAMGIHLFFSVNKREIKLTEEELKKWCEDDSAIDLKDISDGLEDSSNSVVITDFYSSELAMLLSQHHGSKVFYDLLLSRWDEENYASFLHLDIDDTIKDTIPSSFLRQLQNAKWILEGDHFVQPKECYLRGGEAEKILGSLGKYVEPKPIFQALDIRGSLHWKQIIKHIEQWNSEPVFSTTTSTMIHIYKHLVNALKSDIEAPILKEKLEEMRFIFVPGNPIDSTDRCLSSRGPYAKSSLFNPEKQCEGHFYEIHRCVVEDGFEIIDRVRGWIPELIFINSITKEMKIRALNSYYMKPKIFTEFDVLPRGR